MKDTVTLLNESLQRGPLWEALLESERVLEETHQDYPCDKHLPLHQLSVAEMSIVQLQSTSNCMDCHITCDSHVDITTIDVIDARTLSASEIDEVMMHPITHTTFLSPFRTRKFVTINARMEVIITNEIDLVIDGSLPQTNFFSPHDVILSENDCFDNFDDEPTKPFNSLQSLEEYDELEIHIEVCGFDDEEIALDGEDIGNIITVEESDIISEITLSN